jgi:WD40 repeat protein
VLEPSDFAANDETPSRIVEKVERLPYTPRVKGDDDKTRNQWLQLQRRPYLSAGDRRLVQQGVIKPVLKASALEEEPAVYHVDFTPHEVTQIMAKMSEYLAFTLPTTTKAVAQLCSQYHVSSIIDTGLPGRTELDIRNYCSDLMAGQASKTVQVLSLNKATKFDSEQRRSSRIPSLLLARELEGNCGFGRTRQYVNFQTEFKKAHEDGLGVIAEFTNCAGDIATATWVPDNNILCGTTAHSDSHNQQYNRPGNLLLCSTSLGVLRAFPDHRVPRPLVEKGENATEAMRLSQDPWLYSSVVSSDYDSSNGLAFTSSFDKTVKVWTVSPKGELMHNVATWQHIGNVNFVAAAKDGSGRVVAAADAPADAVRIYTVDLEDIQNSQYYTVSCSRTDADESRRWAYCPATVQWGKAPAAQHLLVVGYSPRSLINDDQAIPEDKKNSGEICLWDAHHGCRLPVLTATTANVFEVAWHPTLQSFVVATSPCGLNVDYGVRTQIHVFHRTDGAYSEFQKLDCFASDINELAIMPNSISYAYICAACTDGKVYIWDTAHSDKPIHVLKHGYPLDEFYGDREREDTGVKFVAWGSSVDRLYTGSSDGVVKVWNIRNRRKPFVRNLLHAPGPISCGTFSPNCSQLAIGDATGRLFLLSVDMEQVDSQITAPMPGTNRRIRRPKPFTPHAEPPPPESIDNNTRITEPGIAEYSRTTYLDTNKLTIHPNPVIGAVQGPDYASTNLFRLEAHLDDEASLPLLTQYERKQQGSIRSSIGSGVRSRSLRRMRLPEESKADKAQHKANVEMMLDIDALSEEIMSDLVRAGALLNIDEDWKFTYEDGYGEE